MYTSPRIKGIISILSILVAIVLVMLTFKSIDFDYFAKTRYFVCQPSMYGNNEFILPSGEHVQGNAYNGVVLVGSVKDIPATGYQLDHILTEDEEAELILEQVLSVLFMIAMASWAYRGIMILSELVLKHFGEGIPDIIDELDAQSGTGCLSEKVSGKEEKLLSFEPISFELAETSGTKQKPQKIPKPTKVPHDDMELSKWDAFLLKIINKNKSSD